MEILRASCYEHSYPPHFHNEYVIAAFARGAQRTRICRERGVAAAGTVMVIMPGEVHTGEAVQRDEGWDYCAIYPSASLIDEVAETVMGGKEKSISAVKECDTIRLWHGAYLRLPPCWAPAAIRWKKSALSIRCLIN
jgi:hypothetical protein